MFLFVLFVVVLLAVGLLYWYLKDYERSGALKSHNVGSKVPMEREKFIPQLRHVLVEALQGRIPGSTEAIGQLNELIELVVGLENRGLLSALLRDFEAFDPTQKRAMRRVCASSDAKQKAEKRFLANFCTMMRKANFKLLSTQELDFAHAEQYLLHIPVTSEWEKIDNSMLSTFFDSVEGKQHNTADKAALNKLVVVWRRGVGVDRTTGLLLADKIDVLLTRWFEAFANKVVRSPFWQQLSGTPPMSNEPAESAPHIGHDVEVVERISLNDMPLSWAFLSKPTTIQEPTFKEVVALFRYKENGTAPAQGVEEEPVVCATDPTAIHIKTFRDIPMADLDIIFPAQKILFKTVDFIRLGLTGVLGLYFALDQVSNVIAGEDIDGTMMTACIGLLALASRTYWNVQWSVDVYKTILSETLYSKAGDNHKGVILYLAEALEAQELKETLLAYTLALEHGRPLTEKELDAKCEVFLNGGPDGRGQEGTPSVDFEVDDAVDKLARIGLARVSGPKDARIVEALSEADAIANAKKYIQKLVSGVQVGHGPTDDDDAVEESN